MGPPPFGGMPHGQPPPGPGPNSGSSDGRGSRVGGWIRHNIMGKKDVPEKITLEQMSKNYQRFMRSLRDDLIGKDDAEEYVSVIEKERNELASRIQKYSKF